MIYMKKATAVIIALLALTLCLLSGCTQKQRDDASNNASGLASDIMNGASDAASDIRGDLTEASRNMTNGGNGNVGDENSDGRIDNTTDSKVQSTPNSAASGR